MRHNPLRPLLILSLVFTLSAPILLAESAGGVSWTAPNGWTSQPKRMRAANYVVPAAGGDSEGGECGIYFFGPGQGGSVEANVRRWIGQFRSPYGGPADSLAKRATETTNGISVTTIDLTGTYLFKPFPMAQQTTPKPGYRMLAAIAEAPQGPVFFKLTAPEATTAAAEATFRKMLSSLKK